MYTHFRHEDVTRTVPFLNYALLSCYSGNYGTEFYLSVLSEVNVTCLCMLMWMTYILS